MATPSKEALLRAAITEAWKQGTLSYKLHATQQKIYDALANKAAKKFFLLCSRRLGKSYLLTVIAIEQALKKPNARILFLAPQAKDATDIANDLAAQILEDCPADLKPDYNSQTKEFRFKNGSLIRLRGVNAERADNLRGTAADLIVVDEAGQVDNLQYLIRSVCLPMVLTTKGRILLASTPPTSPGHESALIFEELAKEKAVSVFTILDAPHIDHEDKVNTLVEQGETLEHAELVIEGKAKAKTTAARREYFCEFITDASKAVFPEFTQEAQAEIVKELPKPAYYNTFVGIDPGSRDNTGFIFGYLDFLEGKFVIEDESLIGNPSTKQIAEVIQSKEAALWPNRFEPTRISDIDLRLIRDLAERPYNLKIQKAYKQDMHGSVQYLRGLIQSRKLVIHPRCTNLIRQLQNVIWDKNAADMARDQSYDKHYDLISALRYVARSVNFQKNPYPDGYWLPGGRGGVPKDSIMPRNYGKKKVSLYGSTPIGKKLAAKR